MNHAASVTEPWRLLRQLPNALTVPRLVLSPLLLALPRQSPPFFCLYLLCGVSDALDGFLVRRLDCVSRCGQILGSAADVIFFGTVILAFAPAVLSLTWEIGVIATICSACGLA